MDVTSKSYFVSGIGIIPCFSQIMRVPDYRRGLFTYEQREVSEASPFFASVSAKTTIISLSSRLSLVQTSF